MALTSAAASSKGLAHGVGIGSERLGLPRRLVADAASVASQRAHGCSAWPVMLRLPSVGRRSSPAYPTRHASWQRGNVVCPEFVPACPALAARQARRVVYALLILLVDLEATPGIEPGYTVLQTVA